MAVLQVTRRPLAGGRGSAVVQIEEGAIRQMSLQEQVDAREFARRLAQEIAYQDYRKAWFGALQSIDIASESGT
jgi:hypothetical protein